MNESDSLINRIGLVYIVVPKEHILNKNFEMLMNHVLRVSVPQIKSGIHNFSTIVLSIDGYNNDPRSLWDIPEVIEWFKELHKTYPYIPLFLSPGSIQVYYQVLLPLADKIIPRERDYSNEEAPKALLVHTLYERNKFFSSILEHDLPKCEQILLAADERVTKALVNLLTGKEEPV